MDPTGSGEYRIARSPDEKDALLYVPGAGPTLAEILGLDTKANRIAYGRSQSLFGQPAKYGQFERLDLLKGLGQPPPVKLDPLLKALAESDYPKITYDRLPAQLHIHYLRATEDSVIVAFTIQLENADLVYKDVGGIQQATANIYGRITSIAGRRARQFEDVVTSSFTSQALEAGLKSRSVYQKVVVLAPGNYKIDLAVRDTNSGKADVIRQGFAVPRYPEGELATSTLVLASKLEPLNGPSLFSLFNYGSLKVIPNVTGVFQADQTLGLYLQVYNVALDQATLRPKLDVEYLITHQEQEIARLKEDGKHPLSMLDSQQVTLARLIPLKGLKPGFYELTVKITDHVAGKTVMRKESFQIL